MRKLALVAALAIGVAAGVANAQGGPPGGRGRGPGGPGGRGGPGAPMGMLLRGIELTDAQKSQLQGLRPDSATMEQNRESNMALFEQMRAARESGDSAKVATLMQEQRKRMDTQRDKEAAAVRAILTTDQQAQFDANLAEQKDREAQGFGPGGRGRGRGQRPPPPPPPAMESE